MNSTCLVFKQLGYLRVALALMWLQAAALSVAHAQSPFQFREAYLLERRMQPIHDFVDITHFDENMGRVKPSWNATCSTPGCKDPEGKVVPDLRNLYIYRDGDTRWLTLLQRVDRARATGSYAVAGPVYESMIEMLRKAEGQNSDHIALMLDHLAEYYLEGRNFDLGYKTLEEALQVRRATIAILNPALDGDASDPDLPKRFIYRMHLADMLARVGQIDLGKGDLILAAQRLSEAVAIFNEKMARRCIGSLYAIYFQSLTLEKQGKWEEAEGLWSQAVRLRDDIQFSEIYWDAQKEQAAFYARHGDFRSAARIARKVAEGTAGKQLKLALPMPYLIDSRPKIEGQGGIYSLYKLESDSALKEILAVDKWQTDGALAATTLLPDLITPANQPILDSGSDSERARLLAWFTARMFLHLSVLLDEQSPQDRVDRAYELLSQIKGRYLSSIRETTQYYEQGRHTPHADDKGIAILDLLSEARDLQARLFLASALEGKPFQSSQFGAIETTERMLSSSLNADVRVQSEHSRFSLDYLTKAVPADSAFVDFVSWKRTDRKTGLSAFREYGAFVLRKGQPIRYVRVGDADSIDTEIAELKKRMIGCHTRSFAVGDCVVTVSEGELKHRLKSMFVKIITPLEANLKGATGLFIVPDGSLTLAPMGAFVDPNGHYLFETRTITYLDSWRDLIRPKPRSQKMSAPAILANPDFNLVIDDSTAGLAGGGPDDKRQKLPLLPGAEKEGKEIANDLHISADRLFTGKAARKQLVQSLDSPAILHFATHSIPSLTWKGEPVTKYDLFDVPQLEANQNPLIRSFIALAGANLDQVSPDNGLLTGIEVTQLHLSATKLVVLSSCESGQGTPVEGQGVLGLRAAFRVAGAQALVMTLWPVDDQAGRQFMKYFYSHIDEGSALALRLAQMDMFSNAQYRDPFYWSGYVVSGDLYSERVTKEEIIRMENVRPKDSPLQEIGVAREVVVTPRCFEFFTRGDTNADPTFEVIRLKIGAIVHRTQTSSEEATYDLIGVGNSVQQRKGLDMYGTHSLTEIWGVSGEPLTAKITVSSHKDGSSLSLSVGGSSWAPEDRQVLLLTGGPELFPNEEIPEVFPTVSSFKATSDSLGEGPNSRRTGQKLYRISACTPTPSW